MRCFLFFLCSFCCAYVSFSQCNGAWPTVSGANRTISVDSRVATGNSLTGTLTVNAGITLCTEGTAAINVSSLTNNGTINHTGSGTFTASSGVTNNGTITTSTSAFSWSATSSTFTTTIGSSINVNGNITFNYTTGTFGNSGSITSNAGNFSLSATTGSSTNQATGSITTTGGNISMNKLTNYGSISSAGTFTKSTTTYILTNQSTGTITTTGNMAIEGTTNNYGLISAGGTYTKAGTANNFTNQSTGTVTATGNIAIEGGTENYGQIISTGGGYTKTGTSEIFTNQLYSTLTTAGNIRIEGTLTNIGSITSTGGTFTKISSATSADPFENQQGGQLKAYGDISIQGHIDNCGLIEITNSGSFTKTTTTNPLTTGPSALINQAGSTIMIRGNAQIEGFINNSGNIKIEGQLLANLSTGSVNRSLNNNTGGYTRVCGELYYTADVDNAGTMEVLGQIFMSTASNGTLTNRAGAVLNVTEDIDIISSLTNSGCITVGDSLWKRNSSANITISGGTIYCTNFVQDDGILSGGSSSARGYLVISGISTTLNTVSLSNYLDLCDASGAGAGAQYFDTESPAYAYPASNVTDCGSAPPCTQATLAACVDALPAVSGDCSNLNLLPVELLFLKAECVHVGSVGTMNAKISWATASETNNNYFTIDRSPDGTTWESFLKINGAGNSGTYKYYEAYDPDPMKGTSYYLLKQTDYDGQHAYFPLVSVKCSSENGLVLFPNPFYGEFIYVDFSGAEKLEVELFNVIGEKIYSSSVSLSQGTKKEIHFDGKLAAGIYIISITSGKEVFRKKLLVVK